MFELQKKTLCSFCYGIYFMSNIMCALQHLICKCTFSMLLSYCAASLHLPCAHQSCSVLYTHSQSQSLLHGRMHSRLHALVDDRRGDEAAAHRRQTARGRPAAQAPQAAQEPQAQAQAQTQAQAPQVPHRASIRGACRVPP